MTRLVTLTWAREMYQSSSNIAHARVCTAIDSGCAIANQGNWSQFQFPLPSFLNYSHKGGGN